MVRGRRRSKSEIGKGKGGKKNVAHHFASVCLLLKSEKMRSKCPKKTTEDAPFEEGATLAVVLKERGMVGRNLTAGTIWTGTTVIGDSSEEWIKFEGYGRGHA